MSAMFEYQMISGNLSGGSPTGRSTHCSRRRRLGFRTAEVQGGSWHDVQDFMVKVDKMFDGRSMVC